MAEKNLVQLLTIIALAGPAAAGGADSPIQISIEEGKPVALFRIGNSRCVLVDDQIRCVQQGAK